MGAGRGAAHSGRQGHSGIVYCSASAPLPPQFSLDASKTRRIWSIWRNKQPRNAGGVASYTRRGGRAWGLQKEPICRRSVPRHGLLCPPPGRGQDGAAPGSHRWSSRCGASISSCWTSDREEDALTRHGTQAGLKAPQNRRAAQSRVGLVLPLPPTGIYRQWRCRRSSRALRNALPRGSLQQQGGGWRTPKVPAKLPLAKLLTDSPEMGIGWLRRPA